MRARTKMAAAAAVALAGAMFLPSLATAAPTSLVSPTFAGVGLLPGPVAPASTPAAVMTTLATTPDIAPAGTPFTLSGSGLPASQPVSIVWGTANVTWVVDARPDSVDYLGRSATKVQVVLGQAQTDAQAAFQAAYAAYNRDQTDAQYAQVLATRQALDDATAQAARLQAAAEQDQQQFQTLWDQYHAALP